MIFKCLTEPLFSFRLSTTMFKRNDKQNLDRKFKDIQVGDRVYLKNNIRRHKFVSRYSGPFRVIAIKGSTVYCYSLASKKHKQVTMDKCRYAGDLSQDDALIQAFPEEEPETYEDNEDPSQIAAELDASEHTESRVKSSSGSNLRNKQHLTRKSDRNVRYNLRQK